MFFEHRHQDKRTRKSGLENGRDNHVISGRDNAPAARQFINPILVILHRVFAWGAAMINSVSTFSSVTMGVVRPTATANTGPAFNNMTTNLNNTGVSSRLSISISNTAKYKSSLGDVPVGFDFTYNNIEHTQEEFKSYYADGSRQISESQGLPEGKYDFTRISAKQASIIMSDAILNRGTSIDDLQALGTFVCNNRDFQSEDHNGMLSDALGNAFTVMKQQRSYYGGLGNSDNVALYQRTIDWMNSIHSSAGEAAKFDTLARYMDMKPDE